MQYLLIPANEFNFPLLKVKLADGSYMLPKGYIEIVISKEIKDFMEMVCNVEVNNSPFGKIYIINDLKFFIFTE